MTDPGIGSDILNGTMMIQGAIMTKTIIEPDIPRHIKTKRSCLTSLGNMPEYGGGMFQYLDKDVSGLIQIIIKAKDIVHVAPAATIHEVQFYIWKRQK